MNLVIDVGNSFIKFGVFDDSKLLHYNRVAHPIFETTLTAIHSSFPKIRAIILSSVGSLSQASIQQIKNIGATVIELNHTTAMPFINCYGTPHTLGVDRLALTAAAVYRYPQQHVLVIDAGTCITYDFKNENEEYLGGAIAPGIQMRYRSLHQHTAKLPLLTPKFPESYLGANTNDAIHAGVTLGIIHEIEGVIHQYCNTYENLTVILTGGDVHFLSKRLKNGIFATSNFLLEGLNHILAFNTTQ